MSAGLQSEQLVLELEPLAQPAYDPELSIQERFEAFHAANLWVYLALEKLTVDWLAAGHRRAGMKQLTEVLRWHYGRQTVGEEFKLNNNFTSRYARLLVERHPEWSDVFETRTLRAA